MRLGPTRIHAPEPQTGRSRSQTRKGPVQRLRESGAKGETLDHKSRVSSVPITLPRYRTSTTSQIISQTKAYTSTMVPDPRVLGPCKVTLRIRNTSCPSVLSNSLCGPQCVGVTPISALLRPPLYTVVSITSVLTQEQSLLPHSRTRTPLPLLKCFKPRSHPS